MQFSSMQLQSGHIFVIGGQAQDLVLRSCFEIDGNMVMLEKEPMKTGRYNSALALLSDKLIFAIGGSIGKGKVTDTVECYDTATNTWTPVGSLNKARSSTSACSVGNRYLYVFPGQQKETWNTIECFDVGSSIQDMRELKKLKWSLLTIANQDMASSYSFGSVLLAQNELLLFGGNKTSTFLFDFANTLT